MSSETSVSAANELSAALKYLQASDVDLDVLSGDSTDFLYFIAAFKQAVETKVSDPYVRLTRLIKYTKGEAKELIKGCVCLPPNESYSEPMRLLNQRYRNLYRILTEHRKQLIQSPKLKPNEPCSFVRFLSYLLRFS